MQVEKLYPIYKQHPSVQTDTRKLKAGDLFFALKGDNFNGNAFAKQALDAGAAYAVIDEAAWSIPGKTLLVTDVLTTLQQLAKYHRQQFSIPVLAITGSNGKTTTKELIHAVLSSSFKTYTTEGNLNNHIGIPLTLLAIRKDAELAVIEMGANHLQEIASYCGYVLPTWIDHQLRQEPIWKDSEPWKLCGKAKESCMIIYAAQRVLPSRCGIMIIYRT
jgi:UDP-N-acetylmuramoyl-tripeptide--D-alanyl-D-alanine ligase